jgi:hypothetical protein
MTEHTVTYVPLRYPEGNPSYGIPRKNKSLLGQPDPAPLWTSLEYENHFRQMWQDGWDLVNVQPLLQGYSPSSGSFNTDSSPGFSITAGYYFFWKRSVS